MVIAEPKASRTDRAVLGEAATSGLAYGAFLCWLSTCVVGSLRPTRLADPYWSAVPALRTDTCGILSFLIATVGIVTSEYLRLTRTRQATMPLPQANASSTQRSTLLRATAEAVALMSTCLITYLSLNAVTHPITLAIQATHLASWPTEGTLRVMALGACVISVGVLRYQSASDAIAR